MIGGLIVILITGMVSFLWIDYLKKNHPLIDAVLLKRLFFYHLLLFGAYYGYVLFNPSDSKYYYEKVITNYRGNEWFDFYGTSTRFIEFLGYPFIKYLGFSYEAIMALFSFSGFLGFLYFYIFFKENLSFKQRLWGLDLVSIILFLPNLHFWSSSFGKGSVIFMGIGLFFYALSNLQRRIPQLIIASVIVYHVRPHIMLVMLVSSAMGFIFSTKNISIALRLTFLTGASIAFFLIYRDVFAMVGIDEDAVVSQGFDLTHRATELTKATSGVDITSYGLPFQLFTFLYRPLFIDAPGILGIIVSFENVFCLFMTFKLMSKWRGIKFILSGNFLIKSAFLSFVTVSIALSQIAGNLGLAMRQKSQVMILLLFVIVMFLDSEKYQQWLAIEKEKIRKKRSPAFTARPTSEFKS
jgi:hypothetical protein